MGQLPLVKTVVVQMQVHLNVPLSDPDECHVPVVSMLM